MRHGLAVILLVVAVTGALARPWRRPSWVPPTLAAAVALLAGSVTLHETRVTLRPLAAPLAFVGLAVPLAVPWPGNGLAQVMVGGAPVTVVKL